MKTLEKRERLTEYTVIVKRVCDICKNEINNKGSFSVEEGIISYKTGDIFPEGGCGEKKEFDICLNCFENTIEPFMESFNAEAEWEDWDV